MITITQERANEIALERAMRAVFGDSEYLTRLMEETGVVRGDMSDAEVAFTCLVTEIISMLEYADDDSVDEITGTSVLSLEELAMEVLEEAESLSVSTDEVYAFRDIIYKACLVKVPEQEGLYRRLISLNTKIASL